MQTVIIGKNQAGQRLDKFLHKYLPAAGNSFLYKMLRKKNITLNGRRAEGREMLAEGDKVVCFFSEETFAKFSQGNDHTDDSQPPRFERETAQYQDAYRQIKGVSILYEDTDILALNKPAGVLSQKAEKNDLSLNEWLIGYLMERGKLKEKDLATFHPSICNRLDRNTSGIVLCGKTFSGSKLLNRMIREHRIHKFYRTICVGEIKDDFRLEGFWSKDRETNQVTISKTFMEDSQPIGTGFHVLKTAGGYTLLEAELFTGKTHQIRAHLAGIGHPIIGDGKYGDPTVNEIFRKEFGLKHQLLHAYQVSFPKDMFPQIPNACITAPCTEIMKNIENKIMNLRS